MKYFLFLSLSLALAYQGYSQVLVSYDKAEGLDLSKYTTFQIHKLDVNHLPEFEPRKEGLNQLIGAITNEMETRGFEKVSGNPDLFLNIGVKITEEVQTRETDIRDAPVYMGQRNYSWKSEEIVVNTYNEGTVVLDIVDTEKNEMIWQGVVKGVLSQKRSKNEKRINRAVEKLFKKFPVAQLAGQ